MRGAVSRADRACTALPARLGLIVIGGEELSRWEPWLQWLPQPLSQALRA